MSKKGLNEGYKPNIRHDGYQPGNKGEQRGYQPKPNGNFGYQPNSNSSVPPSPPSTGSNIVVQKKN